MILDAHVLPDLQILLAALGRTEGEQEVAAALALVCSWVDGEPERLDDVGDVRLVAAAHGLELRLRGGRLLNVSIELRANVQKEAFGHPERLLDGLGPDLARADAAARYGEPIESHFGNDAYLVADARAFLTWRRSGELQRLSVAAGDPQELARLRRAVTRRASAPADPDVRRVEVPEEDGILAIVDPDAYATRFPDWSFAAIVQHLADEGVRGHGAFWRTGRDDYATYVVEVRSSPSRRRTTDEWSHVLESTAGRLRVVGYGTLTMAGDEDADRLQPGADDADVVVPTGRLHVRVRRLAARRGDDADRPRLEIVVRPATDDDVAAEPALGWWDPSDV